MYPGVTGTPAATISLLAASFSPIARIAARRCANPDEAGGLNGFRKLGILGEEAVAGMDRLRRLTLALPL